MSNKNEQNQIGRFFGSRLFLIIGIPLALLVVFSYVRSYYSGYRVNQEIAALENEIKRLEHKKIESMEILDYVMSSRFVEDQARTELNMKKDGENVVVFKNENEYDEVRVKQEEKPGQKMSNPLKWVYYFVNKDRVLNNK